jgi:orotidine-5'-phosphate decarboxylase
MHVDNKRGAAARKLIVALDFSSSAEARKLVSTLHAEVCLFKIGLELIYADGLPLASILIESGYHVFLDAKLLDIPNTVERATANAVQLGVSFLTVHGADRKTLDAAVRGRGASQTKLLAITVLTSLDAADLESQGITLGLGDLALRRALMAREAGFDGVVASAHEAAAIRREVGADFLIVTPGIRPGDAAALDQSRVVTPAGAIAAGADYLVVGRPISTASDPYEAANRIIAEIEAALG